MKDSALCPLLQKILWVVLNCLQIWTY